MSDKHGSHRIEQGSRHARGYTDEEIAEIARGYDSEGRPLGGYHWQETERGAHITGFDAVHGTRVSYDVDTDGNYIKHETDQNINPSKPGRHAEGAYRAQSDAERGITSESSDADKIAAGYYKVYQGGNANWRHK